MKRGHELEPKLYQFRKCRLLRDGELIKDDLWVRAGKIIDPRKVFWEEQVQADVQIDCNNLIISPGFIDLQINGKCKVKYCKRQHYFEKHLLRGGWRMSATLQQCVCWGRGWVNVGRVHSKCSVGSTNACPCWT